MIHDPAKARAELLADTKEAVTWWAGTFRPAPGWLRWLLGVVAFSALYVFLGATGRVSTFTGVVSEGWPFLAVAVVATTGLAAAYLRGPWRESAPGWSRTRGLAGGVIQWGSVYALALMGRRVEHGWVTVSLVLLLVGLALDYERTWRWGLKLLITALLLALATWLYLTRVPI